MVETMHSQELSPSSTELDLPDLPEFPSGMRESWPLEISWSAAVHQMAPFRNHYMLHHDSPEQRFSDKNPAPFVLD
jgi:hypothetical protein